MYFENVSTLSTTLFEVLALVLCPSSKPPSPPFYTALPEVVFH